MTDVGFAVERASALDVRTRRSVARALTAGLFWAVVVGNVATIVWLWWHGGNVTHVRSTGELLTSIARITGLLGAYLALLQVVLLRRSRSRGSTRFRPETSSSSTTQPRITGARSTLRRSRC